MSYDVDEIDRLYERIRELLIKMAAIFDAMKRAADAAKVLLGQLNQEMAKLTPDDAIVSDIYGQVAGKLAETRQLRKLHRIYNNQVFRLRFRAWRMQMYNKVEAFIRSAFQVKEKTDGRS